MGDKNPNKLKKKKKAVEKVVAQPTIITEAVTSKKTKK
jgi:non-canonical (house-cleaning) NTP pyrophosphatase